MAAIAESPVTTEPLPDLASAFDSEMAKGGDYQPPAGQPEYVPKKEAAKEPVKEPAKEPAKEAVKVETTKKKSALDSAIADEVPAEPAKPDELETLLATEDPKKENWTKAREALKKQSEELRTLRETSKKLSEPPPEILTELKTLKEERQKLIDENAKYRDSVMALDVKYDPGFQEKHVIGREKSVTSLGTRIESAGGGAKDDFIQAMELPLNKRSAAIDALLENISSPRERATIEAKLAQIELNDEERDNILAQPHQSFEQMRQQREVQAKEHQEKIEQFKTATFEKIQRELPKLSKLMRMAPSDAEGAAEFNEQLQKDIAQAPKLLDVAPEEAAVSAYKAARYDSVEKMVVESRAKIAELEDELSKYEGATPGFRGGTKPVAKPDYETPLQDAFAKAMQGQQMI